MGFSLDKYPLHEFKYVSSFRPLWHCLTSDMILGAPFPEAVYELIDMAMLTKELCPYLDGGLISYSYFTSADNHKITS